MDTIAESPDAQDDIFEVPNHLARLEDLIRSSAGGLTITVSVSDEFPGHFEACVDWPTSGFDDTAGMGTEAEDAIMGLLAGLDADLEAGRVPATIEAGVARTDTEPDVSDEGAEIDTQGFAPTLVLDDGEWRAEVETIASSPPLDSFELNGVDLSPTLEMRMTPDDSGLGSNLPSLYLSWGSVEFSVTLWDLEEAVAAFRTLWEAFRTPSATA